MTRRELIEQIKKKKSMLCIGLDTDIAKIPAHLKELDDPIFEFNRSIIDATYEFAVAYKPNIAFYEAQGVQGWRSLKRTIQYLNKSHPELFTIADAKRGDIGNTSTQYAKAFFEDLNFDSITVAPYMGQDSVSPFLQFKNKWTILLALTSNPGAQDFQTTASGDGEIFLFEKVLQQSIQWGTADNLMFVVGATRTDFLQKVRAIAKDHFLLVPGVGAQGGDLEGVIKNGMGDEPNLLINSSRGVIHASRDTGYTEAAREQAQKLQAEMAAFL